MEKASDKKIAKQVFRDAMPAHITFKIQSFSLLTSSSMKMYETHDFEAAGYQWKLLVYPNGNTDEKGGGHISMYLEMAEKQKNPLPHGWVLDVFFRFLVFDQTQDKYLILGDMEGNTRRFHGSKRKWGCSQLLPLTTLNDASNGFLVDDTCVFGAEVFICKNTGNEECLTMVEDPVTVNNTWRIESFSKILEDCVSSDEFDAGSYKWKVVLLYPKGKLEEKDRSIALYLKLSESVTHCSDSKVYAKYMLRIRNQIIEEHIECVSDADWFIGGDGGWGWQKFIKLSEFNENNKGLLMNDTCIIEAEVTILGYAVGKLP